MLATDADREIFAEVLAQLDGTDLHIDDVIENVADQRGMDYFDVHDAVSRARAERGY